MTPEADLGLRNNTSMFLIWSLYEDEQGSKLHCQPRTGSRTPQEQQTAPSSSPLVFQEGDYQQATTNRHLATNEPNS